MGFFQFTLIQSWHNEEVVNSLCYETENDDILDMQVEVDNLRKVYTDNEMESRLVNEWSLNQVRVRDLINGGPGILYTFTEGPLSGEVVLNAGVATTTAFLLSFLARSATFPNRGRIYLPGLNTLALGNDGFWVQSVIDAIQVFSDDLMNVGDPGPNGMDLHVVRLDDDGLLVQSNPIDTTIAQPNPATQRRRRQGVGA